MIYVYILQNLAELERYCVGATTDLRSRLRQHNAGAVAHTAKYAPWKIRTYVAFSDEKQAFSFERYLKNPLPAELSQRGDFRRTRNLGLG
jgi:predicted GIY-YIG superfamily endonuclease